MALCLYTKFGEIMRSKNFIIPLIFLAFALLMEMPLSSTASSVVVVQGDVKQSEADGIKKIEASNNSVIEVDSFDVAENQNVEIVLPDENSYIVIQVNSPNATEIKSHLKANGHVYIVNPHGIFLDKKAHLDQGHFHLIGSKLQTHDAHLAFNIAPTTGDIVNHGKISTSKSVSIYGKHVINTGEIHALEKITIKDTNAKNRLAFLHTGTLKSSFVYVEAKGGSCEIYGKIDAKNAIENQYGGKIQVLAHHVRLMGAYLDVSGDFAGGQVNLGGGFEGKGPLYKASQTSLDDTSIIDASAIKYGPGGQVVMWSDDLTTFNGEIYAKGGMNGGDAGRVETSSQNKLGVFSGKVNVEAKNGESGLWLMDPTNIIIEDSEGSLDLSQVSSSDNAGQVILNVKAINQFSGGNLEITASNRIIINADIENISSTLNLTFKAGSEIRLKKEKINVPNGKVSLIVLDEENGQICAQKDFQSITAHELVIDAPRGKDNGLIVESNSFTLNPTNALREAPSFKINTDITAKNNSLHRLYLRQDSDKNSSILINGNLSGFDIVETHTHLKVLGQTKVDQIISRGKTSVELIGGGEITGLVDFQNTELVSLQSCLNSQFKIQGDLKIKNALMKVKGKLLINGPLDAKNIELCGHSEIDTQNHPLFIRQNIYQNKEISNLTLNTLDAEVMVEGNVHANDFVINTNSTPALCGEVWVKDFTTNAPSLTFSHDLIVSGKIACQNLTTTGLHKKIAFANGGHFKGKTSFDHSGSITLGNYEQVVFSFDEPLDTSKSITYMQGKIQVNGPIITQDVRLIGNTTLNCSGYECRISGDLFQDSCNAKLTINSLSGLVSFKKAIEIDSLYLNTEKELEFSIPLRLKNFSTMSPKVTFYDHLFVDDSFCANNLQTIGDTSSVTILGDMQIKGLAQFNNKAQLMLGKSSKSHFDIKKLYCPDTLLKAQGSFNIQDGVNLHSLELLDNTSFVTHGSNFIVENALTQNQSLANLEIHTQSGTVSILDQVYVNDLIVDSSESLEFFQTVIVNNFITTSPQVIFNANTLIKGNLHSNSILSKGEGVNFQLTHGGLVNGDIKLSNTGAVILGHLDETVLELSGTFDRLAGETIFKGVLRSHGSKIDIEKLNLAGKASILSVDDQGKSAQISFHSTVNGAHPLTVNAGSSKVTLEDAIGNQEALQSLHIYGSQIETKGNIKLDQGALDFYGDVFLTHNVLVEDLGRSGVTFHGKINGSFDCEVYSNNHITFKKDIGSHSPLNALLVSAPQIDVSSNITASNGAISFNGPVNLYENVRFVNLGSTGISFNGEVNGAHVLELYADKAQTTIAFNSDIGTSQSLKHLIISTHTPLVFNHKVVLENFETTSPRSQFISDLKVSTNLTCNDIECIGVTQDVAILGQAKIFGHAQFLHKGLLILGSNENSHFFFKKDVTRKLGKTKAFGTIELSSNSFDMGNLDLGSMLTIKSEAESKFLFSGSIDGVHSLKIEAPKSSVSFIDYVGHKAPLKDLSVLANTIELQKQIDVSSGVLSLVGSVELKDHTVIENINGPKLEILGSINGEWGLTLSTFNACGLIEIQGSIGKSKALQSLNLKTEQNVTLYEDISVSSLHSISPLITFHGDALIKKTLNAQSVQMQNEKGSFQLLGQGVLNGQLYLNNQFGLTVIGSNINSTLHVKDGLIAKTSKVYTQGIIQSESKEICFNEMSLCGALKISTIAQGSSGATINISGKVEGEYHFELDAGNSQIQLLDTLGYQKPLRGVQLKANQIALNSHIYVDNQEMVFNGNVTLTQNINLCGKDKCSMAFLGSLDGPYNLKIANPSQEANLTFAETIGSTAPLKELDVEVYHDLVFPKSLEVHNFLTSSPQVEFLDQTTILNSIEVQKLITSSKHKTIRFLGTGKFSNTTEFNHSGSLVLGSTNCSQFDFSGPLVVKDAVLMTQGQINTIGSVDLKELALKGDTTIYTANGDFNLTQKLSELKQGSHLTLNIDDGKVGFNDCLEITLLKVNTKQNINFKQNVILGSFETNSPFVSVDTSFNIKNNIDVYDITFLGANNSIQLLGSGKLRGNTIFNNGAGIKLGATSSSILTFYGPLDTTSSKLEVSGIVETINKTIDIGHVSMNGNAIIRSVSAQTEGKNIYFLGPVEGAHQLSVVAGSAKICFDHHVGSSEALESLKATAAKIELDGNINAKGGNLIFAGDVTITSNSNISIDGNNNIVFQGTVNADDKKPNISLTLDSLGTIEFQKEVGDKTAFGEVIVNQADQVICRSPFKSNVLTQNNKKRSEVDPAKTTEDIQAKKEDLEKKPDHFETEESISKTQVEQNV